MPEHWQRFKTERVTILGADGAPMPGMRVWFEIPGAGVVDYVEVPENEFSPERVRGMIEERVALHAALDE